MIAASLAHTSITIKTPEMIYIKFGEPAVVATRRITTVNVYKGGVVSMLMIASFLEKNIIAKSDYDSRDVGIISSSSLGFM